MKDVAPYFVPSDGSIIASPWDLVVDGEVERLEGHIENWDQSTKIEVISSIAAECDRIRAETHIDRSDELVWAVGWRTTDTALVGAPTLVSFGGDLVECNLSIGPDGVGAAIAITRRLLLRCDRVGKPGEARIAGSILWSDNHVVRLAGDGAAFPTEVIDFGSVHRDRRTSWYLDLPESVDAPLMGSMLLLINAADTALVSAVTRARRRTDVQDVLLQEMEAGVVEELLRWAIDRWDEVEDAGDETVGSAARALARRVLPDPRAWQGADSMALRSAIISGARALGYGRPVR